MEHQERDLHQSPDRRTLDMNCLSPWQMPPRTVSKAPNGDHPTVSEKSSLNSYSQTHPVTVSHQDADGFCVPSVFPLISAVAWFCNKTIVKPSQHLRKSRCAFVPTVSAFNFPLQCTRPKSSRTTLVYWLMLALCIPTLSACAGPANMDRAGSLGAHQCVVTVLLCDGCRY